ncbi:MAG: TRAP transporter substrate-binding protein DctP [Elusimicrobia bacterium]|nr:TRAP transporter substrate-binding protein DctP [Elusimicrobiota bacterium]
MNCSKAFAAAVLFAAAPVSAETVIKFATLAPAGSTWMKVMTEFDKELQAKTGGQVKFKFYPGGVQGDEKDVVRKMRLGQLQSAGVTGVGLGEITPEVRVLDAPFLFDNTAEVDHVLKTFDKDLSGALEAKGFALIGWTEVGFVQLFTNTPVKAPADAKRVKMWMWEGDPIAEAAFKAFGVEPRPLSITDVMTSLQTGLIDGVYASPMAALALQWFTKTKFVSPVPLAYSAGAVIVSKKIVDGLPADQKAALLDLGKKHMRRLTELGRAENESALKTVAKEGLTLVEKPSPELLKQYEEIGVKARRDLAGKLYSAQLLERIEKSLVEFRKSGKAGAAKRPS